VAPAAVVVVAPAAVVVVVASAAVVVVVSAAVVVVVAVVVAHPVAYSPMAKITSPAIIQTKMFCFFMLFPSYQGL